MKYIIFFLSVLFFSFSFNSCSTEDDDDLGLDTSPNTFVANLEGEAWSAAKKEAILTNDYLIVYGQAANGNIISLKMKLYKYQPVGKAYVLSNGSDHFADYDFTSPLDSLIYWSKNNLDEYGQSGDIELTKLDLVNKLVSGVFKFRAFNNHDKNDYLYLSQGAFTDIRIVDLLTIDITGQNIINVGGDDAEDDTGDSTEEETSSDFINCTVNGTVNNSTSTTITSNSGFLNIEGIYSATEQIMIELPSTLELGTYDLSVAANSIQFTYVQNGETYSSSPAGSFTLTEKTNTRISGSFHVFLVNSSDTSDTVNLTEGTFSKSLLQ